MKEKKGKVKNKYLLVSQGFLCIGRSYWFYFNFSAWENCRPGLFSPGNNNYAVSNRLIRRFSNSARPRQPEHWFSQANVPRVK